MMRLVWDESKRQANLLKYRMDFAELTPAFFGDAVTRPARPPRLFAFGRFADGTIAVVFASLGTEAISIISMRRASEQERSLYEKAKRF